MSADASKLLGPLAPTATAGAPATVAGVIRKAAQATGASFDYLLTAAKVESNLNPKSSARTSSATGLFQFIEQTWLATMRQAGKALGYGRYSDAIGQAPSGRYVVKDAQMRSEVLALRKDPTAAAAMGGALTQQHAAALARGIGRKPSDAELYIAHFFGAGAAAKVINLTGNNPQANAAELFPAAANANRSVFYDKAGGARSVAGVYAELARRYQVARASPTPIAPAVAANEVAPSGLVPSRRAMRAPDTVATATAFATATAPEPQQGRADIVGRGGPVFHSLFHSDERRGPIAPVVGELWGVGAERAGAEEAKAALAPAPPAFAPILPASSRIRPLELFQDARPDARALFDGKI
jgi:hypothetical protein